MMPLGLLGIVFVCVALWRRVTARRPLTMSVSWCAEQRGREEADL